MALSVAERSRRYRARHPERIVMSRRASTPPVYSGKMRESKRAYYQRNKQKILAQRAEHYEKNKDDERFIVKKAAQRAKNKGLYAARKRAKYATDKENNLARQRIWRENNKEALAASKRAYREANKDRVVIAIKAWLAQNRDRVRIYRKTRRARKIGAVGRYTTADISLLWKAQNAKCVGCGYSLELSCTVDHKIPLSRGGSNWPENLQLLCKPCNSSKGTKTMEEWRGRHAAIKICA